MKRFSNLVFLSLTTIAAFFLLIQSLTFLNTAISSEVDRYWLREGDLGMRIVGLEKNNPLPTPLLLGAFADGLKTRKGQITNLLRIIAEHGPGQPTPPEPIFGGLFTWPGTPGRTECFNGWVDTLGIVWRREYAETPDAEKNAFQARLGQLFATAGIEGGKFDKLKIAAGDKLPDVRRKVEAFRVLAMGLNQGGE